MRVSLIRRWPPWPSVCVCPAGHQQASQWQVGSNPPGVRVVEAQPRRVKMCNTTSTLPTRSLPSWRQTGRRARCPSVRHRPLTDSPFVSVRASSCPSSTQRFHEIQASRLGLSHFTVQSANSVFPSSSNFWKACQRWRGSDLPAALTSPLWTSMLLFHRDLRKVRISPGRLNTPL